MKIKVSMVLSVISGLGDSKDGNDQNIYKKSFPVDETSGIYAY